MAPCAASHNRRERRVTDLLFGVLMVGALLFTRMERAVWGTGKTPFAFTVYPFLAMVAVALYMAPGLGFLPLHVGALFVFGLFFGLVALSSLALAGVARPAALHDHVAEIPPERIALRMEYLALGLVLGALFLPAMLRGDTVTKGELGLGGIGGHLLEVGIAYVVIATSQRKGQRLTRAAFVLLVVWMLAFNQVKYLILLPLAGSVLYRWTAGSLKTWQLVVIGIVGPLTLVVGVYFLFGMTMAAQGVALTPALVLEILRHMVIYLVAGTLGLDQLLARGGIPLFGSDGLSYAFAPFENVARFITHTANYFDVVNPLYLTIHTDGLIDSNVFGLFGSLLYRAGWVGAIGLTLGYYAVTYWVWSRWRLRRGLSAALGSWWLAPLLFAWHDPFFIHLSVIEITAVLWLRSKVTLRSTAPRFVLAPRHESA
jgi:hypothetical protein